MTCQARITTVKTMEFRVQLSKEQIDTIESWFPKLKQLWNLGLYALENFDNFHRYNKFEWIDSETGEARKSNAYLPCCPLPWKSYKNETDNQWHLASEIIDPSSYWYVRQMKESKPPTRSEKKNMRGWQCEDGGSGFSCPLPQDYQAPLISDPRKYSLYKICANNFLDELPKRYPGLYGNVYQIKEVGYKYRQSLLAGLSTAWDEYIKSRSGRGTVKRGKPQYKRYRDRIKTLINTNPPKATPKKPEVTLLRGKEVLALPILGKVVVPGLCRRWVNSDGSIPAIATYQISKKPSGWFIYLTAKVTRSPRLLKNPPADATGIDPGIINWLTLDDGTVYQNPRWFSRYENKIKNKQKAIDHKLDHNLVLWLNHPDRKATDIHELIIVQKDKARALMSATSPKEINEIIGASRYQKLRHHPKLHSKRVEKLRLEIAKLREKERRARKHHIQKTATWLMRKYPIVAAEDGLQSQKLRARKKAQTDESGRYIANGARQQTNRAKALSDAGHGRFLQECEQRAKSFSRTFIRYPAFNTTIQCPICDYIDEDEAAAQTNYPGKTIKCPNCEFECGHDQRPGILMMIDLEQQGLVQRDRLSQAAQNAIALRETWFTR